mgnify:CR=1 FL=1
MSEINSFSDYASKYNTNVDYSFLFGGTPAPSASGSFSLSDYAAIKNGSYGKLLKAYYAKQDAEKVASGGETVQKATMMKTGADALKKSADALNNDELWEKKKIKKKDEKTGEEIEVEDYDWKLDEDALKKADISTLKTLFTGHNSFADKVSMKANSISNAAARYTGTYKSNGTYNNALSELVSKKVDEEV